MARPRAVSMVASFGLINIHVGQAQTVILVPSKPNTITALPENAICQNQDYKERRQDDRRNDPRPHWCLHAL